MAKYEEKFTIMNLSGYTLVLDTTASTGLGNGQWPKSIAAASERGATEVGPFTQTSDDPINLKAVYTCQGSDPAINISLEFACMDMDGLVTVEMLMVCPFVNGSRVAETNTPPEKTSDPDSGLAIFSQTFGNSTHGEAGFTIGFATPPLKLPC